MIRKKVNYVTWSIFSAFAFHWISLSVFYGIAGGDVRLAMMLNLSVILLFVILDRFETWWLYKLNEKEKQGQRVSKALKFYLMGPGMKSGMYLYYIFVVMENVLVENQAYSLFYTGVRYGLLVLIAGDKFMEQLMKDMKYREVGG